MRRALLVVTLTVLGACSSLAADPSTTSAPSQSTSTAPKVKKSSKATTSMEALKSLPAAQAKLAKSQSGKSKRQLAAEKTHGMATQGHISARGRRQQTARDVRNAPTKRGVK